MSGPRVIPDALLASTVKRDHIVLTGALVLVAGLAWVYMARMAAGPAPTCHFPSAGVRLWSTFDFGAAVAMWVVMMVAMMLPIVSPWLLALSMAAREREPGPAPYPEVGGFLLGYGAVWVGYSVLAAAGQMLLQRMALLSSEGVLTSPIVGGALLGVAGVYQWTPFRDSCMTHCRSPFAFFLSDWRAGSWGAFSMGARHGIYCAGCCWALMALSFVFGVMSLAWMGLLTAFLLLEKVTSAGPWLGRAAGALLLGDALWSLVS